MRTTALRTAVAGAVAAGTLLTCGTAHATPAGPGVTGRVISQTTIGNTDYVLREITVPPGQTTGWHYHDGPVYGYVQKGTLSHFHSDCQEDGVYQRGGTVYEPGGPVHRSMTGNGPSGSGCSAQMVLPLPVCRLPQRWVSWATRSSPRPPSS